jgi:hypothetical protein
VKSYEAAFKALPRTAELEALLVRTVYAQGGAEKAPDLAAYLVARRTDLAAQDLERLLDGEPAWEAA